MAFIGSEICTLRNVDQKFFESFEMWSWRMREKIIWTERVKNEVLHRIKDERRLTGLDTYCVGLPFKTRC
jgi:hypothetical protein